MRDAKAQSAPEFITSNLWALVMITLLVVLLFYIGLANANLDQRSCSLEGFFTCRNYAMGKDTGLVLEAGQATGGAVIIYSVSCTTSASAQPEFQMLQRSVLIPHGEYRYVAGGSSGNGIFCGVLQKGEAVRRNVCLVYSSTDFPVNHTACGILATRAE